MAKTRVLRTYRFIDKDPVIDEVRTAIQDEGLIKRLGVVATLSSLSYSTIDSWLNGDTKRPQNASVMAVMTSLGYRRTWSREKNRLDVEAELKTARAWLAKNRTSRKTAKRK